MIVAALLLSLQVPPADAGKPPPAPGLGVRIDPRTGWPDVEGGQVGTLPPPQGAPPAPAGEAAPAAAPPPRTALDSPLLAVFQQIGAPGVLRQFGGVTVWWRLSVYGPQGELIGIRELTHTADLLRPDRDRIERVGEHDPRVYGRSGASVFATRGNLPWPTWNEAAAQELELFGLHLRMPWCFGDGDSYAVVAAQQQTRDGVALQRLQLERRLDGDQTIGPEPEPRPRDRFELWCDAMGQPCELVHTLASSGQTRRVLLEDWQEKLPGLRLPCRRVYIDGGRRQTTVLELRRLERTRVQDRDFRL